MISSSKNPLVAITRQLDLKITIDSDMPQVNLQRMSQNRGTLTWYRGICYFSLNKLRERGICIIPQNNIYKSNRIIFIESQWVGNGMVGGSGKWWGEHAVRAPVSRGCMNSNEVRPPTDALLNGNCTLFCYVTYCFGLQRLTAGISSQSTSQAIPHGGAGRDARPTFAIIDFSRGLICW